MGIFFRRRVGYNPEERSQEEIEQLEVRRDRLVPALIYASYTLVIGAAFVFSRSCSEDVDDYLDGVPWRELTPPRQSRNY
jgi:hypothetical protein